MSTKRVRALSFENGGCAHVVDGLGLDPDAGEGCGLNLGADSGDGDMVDLSLRLGGSRHGGV